MKIPVIGEQRVAITESPLIETASIDELQNNLSALLQSNIPAFLVRHAAIAERNIQTNGDLRSIVTGLLLQKGLNFGTQFVMPDIAGTLQRREVGRGDLHQDATKIAETTVSNIDIHTTTRGAGSVLVANAGPFFGRPQEQRPEPTYIDIKTNLNSMLLDGCTDPRFMSPEVLRADLKTGDNVIFAGYNTFGPVWHRFDTTEAPRIACVSEIEASE